MQFVVKHSRSFTFAFRQCHGLQENVVFDFNTQVKVIEASEKDKFTLKQIMAKFNSGKTQMYDIIKAKSGKEASGQIVVMVQCNGN